MSKALAARVERLEQVNGQADEFLTVILRSFDLAENGEPLKLCGYQSTPYGQQPVITARRPGEAEDALLQRAERAVTPPNGVIVLREIRT